MNKKEITNIQEAAKSLIENDGDCRNILCEVCPMTYYGIANDCEDYQLTVTYARKFLKEFPDIREKMEDNMAEDEKLEEPDWELLNSVPSKDQSNLYGVQIPTAKEAHDKTVAKYDEVWKKVYSKIQNKIHNAIAEKQTNADISFEKDKYPIFYIPNSGEYKDQLIKTMKDLGYFCMSLPIDRSKFFRISLGWSNVK
jgi:hypothetical protein